MPTTSDAVAHDRPYYTTCSPAYEVGRAGIYWHDRNRMTKDLELMISHIGKLCEDILVADVGCEIGHATSCVAQLGIGHITAANVVEDFTSHVEDRLSSFENLELRTVTCDAETFVRNEERYDIVCFSSSLHFCPNHLDLVINAAENCLQPSGFLYLTNSLMEQSLLARMWETLHSALGYKLHRMMSGYKTLAIEGQSVSYPISPQHVVETLRGRGFEGYRIFHTSLFNQIALMTRPKGQFPILIQDCSKN